MSIQFIKKSVDKKDPFPKNSHQQKNRWISKFKITRSLSRITIFIPTKSKLKHFLFTPLFSRQFINITLPPKKFNSSIWTSRNSVTFSDDPIKSSRLFSWNQSVASRQIFYTRSSSELASDSHRELLKDRSFPFRAVVSAHANRSAQSR